MKQESRIADYQRNQVMTASPGRLIVMLYDGAVKRMNQALDAFDMKGPEKFEQVNNHLLAAQNIITELTISLDMEKGGEIAQNCFRIYEYFNDRLSEANTKKTREPIVQVRDMMKDLGEAWETIVRKQESSDDQQGTDVSQGNVAIQA